MIEEMINADRRAAAHRDRTILLAWADILEENGLLKKANAIRKIYHMGKEPYNYGSENQMWCLDPVWREALDYLPKHKFEKLTEHPKVIDKDANDPFFAIFPSRVDAFLALADIIMEGSS